jgi:hypothetical protein
MFCLLNTSFTLAVAVSLLASLAYGQQTTEHPAVAWFLQEKSRLEEQLVTNRWREAMAQRALEKAQNALASAQRLDDREAAGVALKAVSLATEALDKVRSRLARDEDRLAAVRSGLARLMVMRTVEGGRAPTMEDRPQSQPQERELQVPSPTQPGLGGRTPSESAGEMAVVTLITGNLYRKSGNAWVPFRGDVPLRAGDGIRTALNGSVELMFTDGSKSKLGSGTTFIVGELNERKSVYELLRGKLHVLRDCLRSRKLCERALEYRSNAIGGGLRGTEFTLESLPDGRNIITVLEGAVEVTGFIDKRTVTASAGQQVSTTPEGKIIGPTSVNLRSISRWWEDS